MQRLLFDKPSYVSLLQQRELVRKRAGQSVPLKWHRFLDQVAHEWTGQSVARCSVIGLVRGGILFAWLPSRDAFLASHLGGLVYMFWGGIPSSKLQRATLRSILRGARTVLVNDRFAGEEAKLLAGCKPVQVPMFIDTSFFSYSPPDGRKSFLFCAGSNDRDPGLLIALAKAGQEVVWLVSSGELLSRYEGIHPNLRLVFRVTNDELREFYQTCRAAIMPARRDFHAAGQTTGLEAISCGAPVVISQCRAASIFADVPGVRVVPEQTAEAWQAAIASLEAEPMPPNVLAESAEWVRHHTNSRKIIDQLRECCGFSSTNLRNCREP